MYHNYTNEELIVLAYNDGSRLSQELSKRLSDLIEACANLKTELAHYNPYHEALDD